jgi:Flp pilus assembly protein TadB
VSKRRKERERRHRLAHAEPVARDESEPRPERGPSKSSAASNATGKRKTVPAPSLQRSVKRAALVLVVLTALIYIVDHGKHSLGEDALQAVLGAAFFVPFDYFLTRVMYRRVGSRLNS